MNGMTILSMMAWTTNEKLDTDEEEKVYAEIRATRTEEQAQRKNRNDIKTPARKLEQAQVLGQRVCEHAAGTIL